MQLIVQFNVVIYLIISCGPELLFQDLRCDEIRGWWWCWWDDDFHVLRAGLCNSRGKRTSSVHSGQSSWRHSYPLSLRRNWTVLCQVAGPRRCVCSS